MDKYYIRDKGATYCEGPEAEMLLYPDSVEVPRRPNAYSTWDGKTWVNDKNLYALQMSFQAAYEIKNAELQKLCVLNLTPSELAEIDLYTTGIKTCMNAGIGNFPIKPASLSDERIWK